MNPMVQDKKSPSTNPNLETNRSFSFAKHLHQYESLWCRFREKWWYKGKVFFFAPLYGLVLPSPCVCTQSNRVVSKDQKNISVSANRKAVGPKAIKEHSANHPTRINESNPACGLNAEHPPVATFLHIHPRGSIDSSPCSSPAMPTIVSSALVCTSSTIKVLMCKDTSKVVWQQGLAKHGIEQKFLPVPRWFSKALTSRHHHLQWNVKCHHACLHGGSSPLRR